MPCWTNFIDSEKCENVDVWLLRNQELLKSCNKSHKFIMDFFASINFIDKSKSIFPMLKIHFISFEVSVLKVFCTSFIVNKIDWKSWPIFSGETEFTLFYIHLKIFVQFCSWKWRQIYISVYKFHNTNFTGFRYLTLRVQKFTWSDYAQRRSL